MNPPLGSTGAQGHEVQMATHSLGPFLLTALLSDRLAETARGGAPARVVWVTSMISVGAPKGGIVWDEATNGPKVGKDTMENYMQSKIGSLFLAHEYAKRVAGQGIVSVVSASPPPAARRTFRCPVIFVDLHRAGSFVFISNVSLLERPPRLDEDGAAAPHARGDGCGHGKYSWVLAVAGARYADR